MKLIEQNQCDSIEFDFTKVEYISGSFADQLYADKMNCALKTLRLLCLSAFLISAASI